MMALVHRDHAWVIWVSLVCLDNNIIVSDSLPLFLKVKMAERQPRVWYQLPLYVSAHWHSQSLCSECIAALPRWQHCTPAGQICLDTPAGAP